jgi:hypothetical protein
MYWYRDQAAFDAGGSAICETIRGASRRLAQARVTPDESYVTEAVTFLALMCSDYERQSADAAAGVPAPTRDEAGGAAGATHHNETSALPPDNDWEARTFIAQGHHRDACQRLSLYKRASGSQTVSFAAYCNLLCA